MKFKTIITCVSLSIFSTFSAFGQIIIEGYTFETGNRGFLSQVVVTAENAVTGDFIQQVTSDNDGKFVIDVQPGINSVKLTGMKDLFHETDLMVSAKDVKAGKAYVKMELKRSPGYIFEITLAEKSDSIGMPTNHIRNALIEVYNNTTKEVVLVYEDHPHPDFKVDLAKGNHYTVMIRKKGFLTKRMEAFVNVAGCILCFEGIGQITPGVSDNLSGENSMGTLLANVELEPLFEGKRIELQNIYYDLGKADIRPDAALELDKAAIFMKDNPQITVELGSHTDSRGKADNNMELSVRRAQSAVDYLVKKGDVEAFRINARGYGEASPSVKCGYDCTENEHARNRRSEIKVLGIAADIPYKSLEKIKYEEGFDDMIAALQEEGQVKIPEDGELPDDIEKAIKESGGDSAIENLADETEDIETEMSNLEKSMRKKAKKKTSNSTAAAEELENDVVKEVKKTKTKRKPRANAAKKKAKKTESIPEADDIEIVKEAQSTAATAVVEQVDTKSEMEETSSRTQANVSDDYTGYKIVVAFKRSAIAEDDKLHGEYKDLSAYKAKAGYYLYMTGDFNDKIEAEEQVQLMKENNPNVYVVEFDNGNRVN